MKRFLKYIAVMVGVCALDLLSKSALLGFLAAKYGDMVYSPNMVCAKCHIEGIFVSWKYILGGDYGLSNLFNIQFVWNKGVSFSALSGIMPTFLVVLSGVIIAYLFYYLFKKSLPYERLPIAMIIGGAFGNVIDRIRFGAVADFIQWHIGGLWTFPAIFNVGDVFITFGVCLYLIKLFISRRKCMNSMKG